MNSYRAIVCGGGKCYTRGGFSLPIFPGEDPTEFPDADSVVDGLEQYRTRTRRSGVEITKSDDCVLSSRCNGTGNVISVAESGGNPVKVYGIGKPPELLRGMFTDLGGLSYLGEVIDNIPESPNEGDLDNHLYCMDPENTGFIG